MNIFPNPSDKKAGVSVALSGFEASHADLQILDAMGRTALQKTISLKPTGSSVYYINETLPAGIYQVKLTGGNKTMTQKWIVK